MHRRVLLVGGTALVATAVTGANNGNARIASPLPDDARFMKIALEEAAMAAFPFGAVIVRNGEVVARGHNRTGTDHDPTAHGEMVAIRAGLAAHGPDALKGATLYTSAEPCCMCMGAILWCGMGRLVFAASLQQLLTKMVQIEISAEEVARRTPFAPIDIVGGVMAEEAIALFK